MARLTPDTCVVQSDDHVSADVDGAVVMMSIERGSYYSLSSTGLRVWELIATKQRIRDIVAQLQQEYDVDSSTCTTDVLALLDRLMERGLAVEASPEA